MVSPVEQAERKTVTLGHISGVHGVSGWLKIHSQTEPREAIFEYQPWLLGERQETVRIKEGKRHGKHLIALLEDASDRDQAESLVNRQIVVFRDQFPDLPETSYYWTDLIGLAVVTQDGTNLGKIRNMLATGANDVMVVLGERERLIPFIQGPYVKRVDLEQELVVVDWDPDF